MALAPGSRSSVAAFVIVGILPEEAVASLISSAGYRLLTVLEGNSHELHGLENRFQACGHGGFHQVDVLGELFWVPAFGNPI